MKKSWIIIAIIPILFFCGFRKKIKPIIVLSSNPITNISTNIIENNFNAKSRIFYLLYAQDGFKNSAVRLQISKQDDKVSNWGYSIVSTKDIFLDTSQNSYKDYIYIQNGGHYILQFFYIDNKDYPFAHREFRVH